jgi:benzoylformate decarboxylase
MRTVRDATFDVFRQYGMTTIFANPGSTEIAFLTGLPDDLRFVLALHEGSVVGIATGYATAAERPALVNLHTTAGLGNAVGALATARTNRVPLVVVVGQQDRRHLVYRPFLAGDLAGLAGDYPVWVNQPARAQDVPSAIARAWHEANDGRGPALVIVPSDDWEEQADDAALAAPVQLRRGTEADPATLTELADLLAGAGSPALVVGADADDPQTWAALVALAERLEAPVWQEPFAARAGFPQDHRLFAGHLPAGRARLREALAGRDLVLAVGAPVFRQYPYEQGPFVDPGTTVALITDDVEDAHHSPVDLAVVAGPASVCAALVERVPARPGPSAPSPRRRRARVSRCVQPTSWRRSRPGSRLRRSSSRRPRRAVPTCTGCSRPGRRSGSSAPRWAGSGSPSRPRSACGWPSRAARSSPCWATGRRSTASTGCGPPRTTAAACCSSCWPTAGTR